MHDGRVLGYMVTTTLTDVPLAAGAAVIAEAFTCPLDALARHVPSKKPPRAA